MDFSNLDLNLMALVLKCDKCDLDVTKIYIQLSVCVYICVSVCVCVCVWLCVCLCVCLG